jgi:N-acetylneuraminic acid mutarotase
MKTNNKLNACILRGSTTALLFSCVIVALCFAINLPQQSAKAIPWQDNAFFGASRSLSVADRVAYQTAIEDIYWRHRIWPDTNPSPKPPLDKVISQAQIEKKVTDYLRNSQALEDYWQRPITADQLQAEMERMASNTKQPEVLRELFDALGSDPFVIAECLARPILAEHLVRELKNEEKVAAIDSTPKAFGVQVNRPYHLPVIASPSGGCTDDTWTPTTLTNAPPGRYLVPSVWTGSEMIVWGGEASVNVQVNTGGRYNPSTDSWTATSTTNAPEGRRRHSLIWTGTEMIVWGGFNIGGSTFFNNGGRYNPITDSWTGTSTTNAPAARSRHGAVWSGSQMIVWGGRDLSNLGFNTGGRYDPNTDSWAATSTTNAPAGRSIPTAIWTGSEMIIWGGETGQAAVFNTGGRYNPSIDSWTATSTTNAPSAQQDHSAVWTNSEMIVWGGYNGTYLNDGGRYNPVTDSWTAISSNNAPSGRSEHTAVWANNSEMIVWGGNGDSGPTNTGGRYGPDGWVPTSTTNAPSARYEHTAVWADTEIEMIVWGGRDLTAAGLNSGGRYCAAAPSPTPTPTASPTPTATATATATATPTATPTATASATPRPAPTPRSRPTPAPRP